MQEADGNLVAASGHFVGAEGVGGGGGEILQQYHQEQPGTSQAGAGGGGVGQPGMLQNYLHMIQNHIDHSNFP